MASPSALPADRRGPPRARATFDGTCGGLRTVRICDVSVTGCFVESLDPLQPGRRVDVHIRPPDGAALDLVGEVVYAHPRIGFGVRFLEVPPDTRDRLAAVVNAALASGA